MHSKLSVAEMAGGFKDDSFDKETTFLRMKHISKYRALYKKKSNLLQIYIDTDMETHLISLNKIFPVFSCL